VIRLTLSFLVFLSCSTTVHAQMVQITMNNARDFVIQYLTTQSTTFEATFNDINDSSLRQRFFAVLEQKTKQALFLTDIDDTLLESQFIFTSIRYRRTKLAQHRGEIERAHSNASKAEIEELLAKEFWDFARAHPEVRILDPFYADLLREAQQRGHIVLALTARPKHFMDITLRQFQQINIELGRTLPENFHLSALASLSIDHGILSSPQDFQHQRSTKADSLAIFLQHWRQHYGTTFPLTDIFYFDDSNRDLAEMVNRAPELLKIQSPQVPPSFHIVKSLAAEYYLKQYGYLNNLEAIGDWQAAKFTATGEKRNNAEALSSIKNDKRISCQMTLSTNDEF
jgi:hypothetical protein